MAIKQMLVSGPGWVWSGGSKSRNYKVIERVCSYGHALSVSGISIWKGTLNNPRLQFQLGHGHILHDQLLQFGQFFQAGHAFDRIVAHIN